MRKKGFNWIFLAMLVLATVISALAQDPGKGNQPASPPMRFDPQTVETFKGMVVAAPVIPKGGLPEPVHFTLKTDREILTVLLGPNWFIEHQGFTIAPLDQVEVKGSRILLEGKNAVLAAEVKKSDKVLKLRDEHGAPMWGGRGRK